MLFLTMLFISVGISNADVFGEVFDELTKGKGSSKKKTEDAPADTASSRSRADIMQIVNEKTPELKKIYNEHLKQKPGFSGKVTLKFTIAASGEIIKISIVSSTTGYAKFDRAIRDRVATWKWNPIESGNTTPTIPFNFTDDSWDI